MTTRRGAAPASTVKLNRALSASNELRMRIGDLRWGLNLVAHAAPKLSWVWASLLVSQGLLAPALILASRSAVNHLADGVGQGTLAELALRAAPALCTIATVLLLTQILAALTAWVRTAMSEWLRDYVQLRIHEKAATLDLAFFESSDSYDLLHRARIDARNGPAQLLEHLGNLVQSGLSMLAIALLLGVYAAWLPLLLIASAAAGLWVVGKYTLAANRSRLKNTGNERRARYQDWLLTQRETAAEIRLFDLGMHIRETFRSLRAQLYRDHLDLAACELQAQLLATAAGWLGVILGMLWILYRAVTGLARLGDVVMCYQAFQQGQRLLRSLLDSAGGIYKSLLFLENLKSFLALESTLRDPANPQPIGGSARHRISVQNVFFSYPGSERQALKGISVELQPGTITALVGDNGAGKSTLIKLLCRFYDPQRGRVLLDGTDLRDLRLAELRQRITVLFQEPLRHHASAGENIALGNLSYLNDRFRIEAAAVAAGADVPIRRLPQTYATVLGKWFGGAELSTGEWQRVALARAFIRRAPIIALDEPTSAMDSWAEADWLQRFRALAADRTALVITHRFTTAMMADWIYVMRDGRVVQSGTHSDLVRLGGHYATAWRAQMSGRKAGAGNAATR